jgi:hypothetical protein
MFDLFGMFRDNSVIAIPMPVKAGDAWWSLTAQVQYQVREDVVGWYGQVVFYGVRWEPTRVEQKYLSVVIETLLAEEKEDGTKKKTLKWFSRKSIDDVMAHLAVQVGMLREASDLKDIGGEFMSTVVYTGKEFDDVS